ncbi:MMPL family transporter [uncultured Lacinutrix sp.]|uniref:MMPL family transporter n=1 Tax=uncultured Lacinutrix sp. TaxID=574032 RepID=UPI002603E38F|nr:MMPL family transporter [uncultured Lacinutrix sp.]
MDKVFYNIYKTIRKQKIISLFAILLLVFGLVFLAFKITFEEDITKLIPTNSKSEKFQKVLKNVNFADKIIVNFKRQSSGTANDLTQVASIFIDSVNSSASAFVKQIQGQVEDEDALNTIDFVYNNLPLFLEPSDYKIIEQKLIADSIQAITNNNYKTLISPSGIIAKKTILKDPLGLSFLGLEHLKTLSFGDDFKLNNGFLITKDNNNLLLFITPKYESSETDKNTVFAKILDNLKTNLNKNNVNKVELEYFGGALIAVANANQIKKDIQFTVSIALTVLLIILILFYKKLTVPIILFIPTIFGGLVAMSILFLIRTKVSAISLGIGSVLLGVTLDYSLHILTHIRSNNNIESLYKDIAKPILMSSLTTALAFLCLLFLQSQALQDLGIFAAVSVISASIFALIFIPQVYSKKARNNSKTTILDRIASYSLHKNKGFIIVVFALFVISLFTYNKVKFNNDLATLNYQAEEFVNAEKHIDALTNLSSKSLYIAAFGDSNETAFKVNDTIFNTLKKLKTEDKIIEFSSIGTLVKSEEFQKKKIEDWQQFWTLVRKKTAKENLITSGNIHGFKPKTFNQFYNFLDSEFIPLSIEDYKELKMVSAEDYITSKADFTTVTTLVKVKESQLKEVVSVFENNPETVVIDRQQMNETFLGNLKNDFNKLVLYSLIVVLALLFLYYKSMSLTLVTSIPIALTWFITIGLMGLLDIKFNIFNIIISTFIFGLGVDYCIFITNGLLHEYHTGEKALPTHKISIILSVITTILGVGVLIFAKHPALHSIALVSIVGILSALIIAFTIQPLLFKLFIGSKNKRPITLRLLIHSVISFGYFGIGGALLSVLSVVLVKLIPLKEETKMKWFHKILSSFKKSVLYTNWFVDKKIVNPNKETFKKQAFIIANHTSFLDILAVGMLYPKLIFLVNDWVYNSPIFGKAVKLAGFYPVSSGIENSVSHLQKKIDQGYSLIAFPEGTRSNTNKIKRFHKGAFYLAEQFNLDIIPVLIHGNSEVLPKGSFVIKNGSITLKILDRISPEDKTFGKNYSERARKIGAHFRSEFDVLRNEIEYDEYFHQVVLEDYSYKGDTLYSKVKEDLKSNASTYKAILNAIPDKAKIIHVSKDSGQLDFLLTIDRPDREITTYIENKEVAAIIKNSFITNNHYKISIVDSITELEEKASEVVILNSEYITDDEIKRMSKSISIFILIKESRTLYASAIKKLGFILEDEKDNLMIFKN